MRYSNIINKKRWNPKNNKRMSLLERANYYHPFDFSEQTKNDMEIACAINNLSDEYDKKDIQCDDDEK